MKFTAIAYIRIQGRLASREMMDDLLEIVVDESLSLPSMFTIKLLDEQVRWTDSAELNIGSQIDIGIKCDEGGGSVQDTLIKGEITALEPDFTSAGDTTLLIRGYDRCHRLHRGKKTRAFKKVSDSDLAGRIAQEAGLQSEIDATNVVHDYVLQNNQTNMEFLLARAERIGYQVYAAGGTLFFKKGTASLGRGPSLVFLENLLSFRPCWSAVHQPDSVTVKGWDPKVKKAIVSQSSGTLVQGGVGKTGGDTARAAFGGAAEVSVTDQPVFTSDEARNLAAGLSADISRQAIQAEGLCIGTPRLRAGCRVEISKVGRRFSGQYLVTSATHVYSKGGYETRFSISGRQPNTLTHLLDSNDGRGRALMHGVVPAVVTNMKDPDNLGRAKVTYLWLGKDCESDWVRIASPMAGPERGFVYLPEVDDEVLVAFEQGDIHHPYIIGALWNSKDKPPKGKFVGDDGKVNQRIIRTRAGHTIILDDQKDKERIIIQDKTGKNEIVIDSKKNSMDINVDGDFKVVAGGKIMLESKQDMSLKSTGNVALEATRNGTFKGVQLALEGSGKAALKAPMVSVEGSGVTEVKGGLVKIN